MNKEILNELNSGTVHITEEVLISIATVETSRIKGVSVSPAGVVELFSPKHSNRDIEVNIDENNVYMTIKVSVEYGINLIKVSQEIQNSVKERIETMTGLNVNEINVIISNVVIPKETKENNKQ
jgi:uncharacterized alkaline shock family protein YloU